uniref:Serpentine Receptor, class T n=1 Tax=Caenorhabditis tropicalis TaxID=1561998 RepID=A0A1I7UAY1_9PELO
MGIGHSYPVLMFSIVAASLCATGISIMHMFEYRMNAVTDDSIRNLKRIITCVKFYHYFMMTSCMCLLFASYNHLAEQKEFKISIQNKFGSLPSYIWCDNCMFINTNSVPVMIFVSLAASSQPFAAVYFGLSVYASRLGLQKLRNSLSQRTLSIQKNFLNSLYLQTAVHVIFISVPLGIFFLSFVIIIPSSAMYMSYILVAMCTQHGSLSTFALLMSNKPLYSVFTKIFLRMKTNIRGADRVSTMEASSWYRSAIYPNRERA